MPRPGPFPTQGERYEIDLYIPPDVVVNTDGSIAKADWGKVYKFNGRDDQFLLSFTGMGMPKVRYIKQRGPEQHGETYLDFRLQPRIIQYVHRRGPGCDRDEYWDNRADTINRLRMNRQPSGQFNMGRLRKIRPDGTMRDIYALIEQGPTFAARRLNRWDEWAFTETLRFICPDPTWFDPERQSEVWAVVAYSNLIFETTPPLPSEYSDHWTLPFAFSGSLVVGTTTIAYSGTWFASPIITLTGPMSGPQVENLSTGERLKLDYMISNGETVVIDLTYGVKTVTSSTGANLIGTLTEGSDLGFHLAPEPEVEGGQNEIEVTATEGAVGTSQIDLSWYTRYIGI